MEELEGIKKVFVLFDYSDFIGVFSNEAAAWKRAQQEETREGYQEDLNLRLRFKVHEEEVQD